jgi:TFIIH basal transcription factor complex TTD-A subunit
MFDKVAQTPPAAPSRHRPVSIKVSSITIALIIFHPAKASILVTHILFSRICPSTHLKSPKMPRATAGKPNFLSCSRLQKTNISKGTLVQCDPSIKAIISKINEENGGLYISEDIDDETCLINTKKLDELKQKLKDV